jgi:hypothetical protein
MVRHERHGNDFCRKRLAAYDQANLRAGRGARGIDIAHCDRPPEARREAPRGNPSDGLTIERYNLGTLSRGDLAFEQKTGAQARRSMIDRPHHLLKSKKSACLAPAFRDRP